MVSRDMVLKALRILGIGGVSIMVPLVLMSWVATAFSKLEYDFACDSVESTRRSFPEGMAQ